MIFRDRGEAGRALADAVSAERLRFPVILGLSPAGLPVARVVAEILNAPLDLFLVHRLGVPGNPGVAMGAVTSGGVSIVDWQMMAALGFDERVAQIIVRRERSELALREREFRTGHSRIDLYGRDIVLIDDELLESEAMMLAVEALRRSGAARVVVAAPLGTKAAVRDLRERADAVICLFSTSSFDAASFWYRESEDVSDESARIALDEVRGRVRSVVV